jgi:hypothetical protein
MMQNGNKVSITVAAAAAVAAPTAVAALIVNQPMVAVSAVSAFFGFLGGLLMNGILK